ncbi:MFS transporter [Mesorhizobium sp. M4B.F.Ca.ET.190.01.1.1]|uniref:MFS transporter n=1 Tax=unclassified Mesorhizobium TaxID=325217 RepID=UPI0010924233|nr:MULTISPECIES: MFS transporter [unclassified Mesorhizobium]TGR08211.1 MFS transporter [Mesorhizobium sp. M4B.F.Ca.ET.200.01.1.1]TGS17568.1 MFS transporter [Mesorhizobium sp. M4B.F.Ca.ET.190.01.1.1]TGT29892.1 MFS transporter [Mesorhizobium sp. M4B.F.Ca.ET.172.01.1.1]TJW00910.1 MAG: MFS transporter [Mesorhizobium sp.]
MSVSMQARLPTSRWALGALLASAFVVALGYGIILPVLPMMVERLAGSTEPTFNARQIGFLTAAYVAAPLGAAFLWGKWSDLIGRRPVLVVGLIGFAVTLVASALAPSLLVLYAGRILNGGFAAAVGPTALAFIADTEREDDRRTRAFGWMSMASIAGLLVGPMLGGFASQLNFDLGIAVAPSQAAPFLLASGLAVAAALGVWCALPGKLLPGPSAEASKRSSSMFVPGEIRLLALAAAAAAGLGAFEVGLTLRNVELAMGPAALGLMFATCSVVMFAVQGLVFSPLVKPAAARLLVAPAFLVMAIGLALIPTIAGFGEMLFAVSIVAASAGVISPLLAYWVSRISARNQGAELGIQSAAVSLGLSVGSAASGLLFGFHRLEGAAFLIAAAAMGLAAIASMKLPQRPLEQPT